MKGIEKMRTLQGMRMTTEQIMEQIKVDALNDTFEKFKKATKHYYKTSENGNEVTKLYKELEKLGANMEYVIETDLQIRDKVFGL